MSPNRGSPGDSTVEALAAHGARLAAIGSDEAAKTAYLSALKLDPAHETSLLALARLALRTGSRSATRTALGQAILCRPGNATARIALGELLLEGGDYGEALVHFRAAVDAAPDHGPAHQGLARALTGLGELEAARSAWRLGFAQGALAPQPYAGAGPPIRVLLLVSQRAATPTRRLIDDTIFAVTALYPEHHAPSAPLPPHDLVFNAISDADLCGPALDAARRIVARTPAAVINHPWSVARTRRADNLRRLAQLPDVIAAEAVGDGPVRRLRATVIDGKVYPLPLEDRTARPDEAAYFSDMRTFLGWRAVAALTRIGAALTLDYAYVDFALAPDGQVILLEANAKVALPLLESAPCWDLRRAAIEHALAAAKDMLLLRAASRPAAVA